MMPSTSGNKSTTKDHLAPTELSRQTPVFTAQNQLGSQAARSNSQFHLEIRAQRVNQIEHFGSQRIKLSKFGAFAFEIETQLVEPAQHSNFDIKKDLANQRE